MSDVRAFTKKQRRAAYLLSDGKSMQSGTELGFIFMPTILWPIAKEGKQT